MKKANQDPRLSRSRVFGYAFMLVTCCLLLLTPGWAKGQMVFDKDYASAQNSGRRAESALSLGTFNPTTSDVSAEVNNPTLAANGNEADFATLIAKFSGISVPVVGTVGVSGEAWTQLILPQTKAGGTTTYVRIDRPITSSASVDLIGLVGSLTGLLSQDLIYVDAWNGAVSGSNNAESGTLVSESSSTVVTDAAGNIYIAIRPTSAYNAVRIRLRYPKNILALGLGASVSLNVRDAFTLNTNICDPASFSDQGKTSGISVNLGDVVKNPLNAIDANTSNYSEISTGTLNILGSASQNIYFPTLSVANSTLKVRLQVSSSTVNANLLGAYHIRAYNGNTLVENVNLGTGLISGLDLLGLLSSGGIATIPVEVASPFDRVEIGLYSTVGLNLAASDLRIYSVTRTSVSCPEPPPTQSPLFQPECANVNIVSSLNADDPQMAVDGNFDSHATLRSDAGILVGLANRAGHLEAKFGTPVPAGKTTYIRIDYDQDVLKSLLAGSIGNLVGGLVNGLVLGNHYFEVQLKGNDDSEILNTSSANLFASSAGQVKIVQDKAGRYYIAIKANQPFTNIKLTDRTTSAVGLLSPDKYLNVYNICYDNSVDICNQAFSTSYDGAGISLGVLQLGKTGVINAQNAIDDSDASFSEINLGMLSAAGYMSQQINYNSLSDPKSIFKIKIALAASKTLNIDLLGAYEILAYNGNTEVYRRTLSSGLLNGTDLVGLLGGQEKTITFAPGKAFDRIEIRVNGLLGASAFESAVKVYNVKRFGPAGSGCEDPDYVLPSPTSTPFESPACDAIVIDSKHADYPWLAGDGNNESYATLTARSGSLLGIGAYSGFLEYEIANGVDANKTTYVRIDMEDNILNRLVSGTLGNLVGAVGGLVLGDHYFTVEAKTETGGTTVLTGSSANAFVGTTGGDLRIVQDNIGRYYIAITPNQSYKNIKITEHFPALVGTTKDGASMKIFEVCREIGTDNCLPAQFTSFDQSGLSLGLLNGAGVKDADHAISDNSFDYSEISTGTVAVLAEVAQRIYFNKLSAAGDTLKVRLQMDPASLVAVDLVGRYKIVTYNGSEVAETFTLQQGLINNLNLLDLFSSGGVQTLTFKTNTPYDRVDMVAGSLLNAALTPAIRLYEVKRIGVGCQSKTTPSPFENPVCVTTVRASSNADNISNLFDNDFDSYTTLRSGANSLLGQLLAGQSNQYTGFVELGFNAPVDANRTAYVRIDFEPTLLNKLLAGSVGGALAGLVDNLLLGNHYFNIQAKNGNAVVLEGATNNNFGNNNDRIRIVQDAKGRYYIAITPIQQFDAIRVTDHTNTAIALTSQGNSMNVYGACVDNPLTDCQPVFTTSYDAKGITLDAAGLAGGSGVTNANHAIDANTTNYSEISLGVVGVGTSVKQIFDFRKTALANEVVNIKLKYGSGALDANLIGGLEIVAYKGVTPVKTLDVQSGLINGLNVLDILNNGAVGVIPFAPGVEFDRISVGLKGIVAVSALPALRVYSIEKDCNTPMFKTWKSFVVNNDANIKSVKGGEVVEYTVHVRNTGSVALNDYIVTDAIPANTTFVSAANSGVEVGGVVTFNGIDIAAGATATVSFKVTVNEDLTGVTKISNVALVKKDATDLGTETWPPLSTDSSEPDETGSTGTDIPVIPISTIVTWKAAVAKSATTTVTSVSGGETIDYTIYVKNTGNQALTGVQVMEALPAGTTLASGSSLTFAPLDIAVGATESVVFQVIVKGDLTGISSIGNVATVTAGGTPVQTTPADPTNPTAGPDPTKDPGDLTEVPVAQNKTVVTWKAYTISASDKTSTSVSAGNDVTYHIYVRNTGNQALQNVTITDVLPAGVAWKSGGSHNTGTVTFTIPTLAVGATSLAQNFTVTVNTNMTGITEIRNIAVVKADPTSTVEFESFPPVDNTTTPTEPKVTALPGTVLTVNPVTNLQMGIVGVSNNENSAGQAIESNTINYTISITNAGNLDLTGVTITNPLANNTIYTAGSASNGGTEVAGVLTFGNIDIAVGDTKTFTYSVTVGPITAGVTKISTTATASYSHEEVGQPNKTVDATSELQTNCSPVTASAITPSGNTEICAGKTTEITLTASSVTNPVFMWYDNAALTGTPLVGATQVINKTYYVVVNGDGVCFNGSALPVTITVNAAPATPTITPSAAAVCEGSPVVLTATSGSASYQWFKGATLLNETSNVLSISAAVLADAGQYTAKALNANGCESAVSAAVEVMVGTKPVKPVLTSSATGPLCAGEMVTLTSNGTGAHQWFRDGQPIADAGTTNIYSTNVTGDYTVKVVNGCESDLSDPLTLTFTPVPAITFNGGSSSVTGMMNTPVVLPTITPETGVTYVWYDNNGAVTTNPTPVFAAAGTYGYTVVATNASNCTTIATVLINIYDANNCPTLFKPYYAKTAKWQSLGGGIIDKDASVDTNPKNSATVVMAVGLVGLGGGYLDLEFDKEYIAGTPVTVKLGKEYSGVGAVSGILAYGLNSSGNSIGAGESVSAGLVKLLAADAAYEFTFVPSTVSGPKAYKGVRLYFGSLLSVAENFKVYGAYVKEKVTTNDCAPVAPGVNKDIRDVVYGLDTFLGLDPLSATASVVDPWNAVDNDLTTAAQIVRGLAVLNIATITPVFKNQVMPSDSLQIIIADPSSSILDLSLLTGFSIQRFNGSVKVGQPVDNGSGILGLKLLSFGAEKKKLIVSPFAEAYDRVKISYGGIANVNLGEQVKVYDVSIKPTIDIGVTPGESIVVCPGEDVTITKQDECTFYEVYDAASGGNLLNASGGSFTFKPNTTTAGTYTYYVQAVRQGCPIGSRQEISVKVSALPTTSSIKLNAVEQTTITLAPYEELNVEVTTDATTTITKWEINESGAWNDYNVASAEKKTFTYDVPLKSAGSQVKFRALLTSDKGCDAYTSEIVLNIKAQEVDYDNSRLVVIKATAIANGTEVNTVEARIRDKFDMPIAGVTVDFTYDNLVTRVDNTAAVVTDVAGNAVLNITSTKIGQVMIDATVANIAIANSPATVTFVAGAIDFSKSNIEIVRTGAVADGVDKNTVRVNLFDKFDNPVADSTVVYTVTGLAGVQTSTLSGTSDASGQFTLDLTSEKIGTASITATVNGTAITVGSPARVNFVAGAIDFSKSNIEIVRTGAVADGVDKNTVRVNLFDKFDNPVADSTVVYTVTGLAGVQTSTLTGTSDASGQFTLDLTSEKIGTASITATANGTAITLGSPARVDFVAGAIDFSRSKIEVVRTGAVADGVDKNTVRVNLFDKFDNPVADSTVVYTVTGLAGVQTSTLTGISDASGQFTLDLTSEKIGTASITATANGKAITVGSPARVNFVAGAIDFTKSNIQVVRTGAVADGVDKNTVRVNLFDKFDNPVADSTVVYTVTGLAGVRTSTLTGISDASGQFTLDLTSEKIGTASITATANGTAITVGSPARVNFVAGAIDFTKSNIQVVRTGAVADGVDKNTVRVNLFDKFDNPVADSTVVYTVTGLAGVQTSTLTGISDAAGQFTLDLTSEKIGTASITATANGKAIIVGSPALVTFVAGAVDYDKSNLKVTKDGAIADGVDYNEFTANIVDKFENPIANKDVIFSITNPDGSKASKTVTTDANGKAVIPTTSTKPGIVTVDAQVDAKSINGSPATAKFVIANNLSITKIADQTSVKAGTNTTFTVTIKNNGPADIAAGKVIKLGEMPSAGLTITGYEVTSGNATSTATGNSATITTNGVIAAGGTITVKVTAVVGADAPSTITNGIKVWGPDKDPEKDPEDDKDETPPIPVNREYVLSIEKKADQTRVKAGENTIFTLTVTNNGPSTIDLGKTIRLMERPGNGVTIEKYEVLGTNATVSGSGNSATLTTTTKIEKGQSIVIKVTAKVDADAPATITNGVTVWGPDKDPAKDPLDDEDDTPPIPVDRVSKLSITKVADQARVQLGETTTFTITIKNEGPSTVDVGKTMQLTERPGVGVTIEKYEIVGSNATISGTANKATVTTTAKITTGGTIVVKVTARINADAKETITNGVTVWGPDKDPEKDPEDDQEDTPPVPVDRTYKTSIVVTDNNAVADGVTKNRVRVVVLDVYDRPVKDVDVIYTVSGLTGVQTSVLSGKSDLQGYFYLELSSTKVGTASIVATVNGTAVTVGSPAVVNFIAASVDDANSNLKVTKDNAKADGVEYNEFTATIMDQSNTPIAGREVVFSIANPDGTRETKSVMTNDKGIAVIQVVSMTAGEVMVDAKVDGASIRNSPGKATFVAVETLDIPNIITPNGDGKNDVFKIKGLALYDQAVLVIVNRWGNEVYKSNNYNNDWSGLGLSQGTYFYVLELVKAGKKEVHKGWVTIKSN